MDEHIPDAEVVATLERLEQRKRDRRDAAFLERMRIVGVIQRVRPRDPDLAELIQRLPDLEGL
jgi:hypothetical protein